MYCSNCGYDLKKKKINKINQKATKRTKDTEMVYICPKCGHIIKSNLNEEEIKALSRASHSEIHRSRNTMNTGMASLVISIILGVIAYLFFLMSFKANAGGQLVTDCTEYYVFATLIAIAGILLGFSILALVFGILKNRKYTLLLKDIQNDIFNQ